MLAQTTLRNILGTRTLSGILSEREQISKEVLSILDTATDPWGIDVERNRDIWTIFDVHRFFRFLNIVHATWRR